jgi:thermitase
MRDLIIRQADSAGIRVSSRRRILAALVAAFLTALLCLAFIDPAGADDDDDDGGEFVSRQIVVKLKPATNIGYINNKYRTRTLQALPGPEKIYLLVTPRGKSPTTIANQIRRNEFPRRVLYVEPNFRAGLPEGSRYHRARPGGEPAPGSDPALYRSQYAVDNLNLTEAHGVNRGAGAVVAVIDTGVQSDHPELAGKTVAGYDFVNGDRTPDDVGNNRDDDRDGERDEMVGHGTHVAGIVALAAPEARIMPVRALDSEGRGTVFGIARAIKFATRNGADVVNLSLGSSRQTDLIGDLIGEDDDDDVSRVTFVAAAGNDANSARQFPAAEENAIAVSSVTREKRKSDFSNFDGGEEGWVKIAAPGSEIHAPFTESRYATWSGTSMATPFVAGQAALAYSAYDAGGAPANSACVIDAIQNTAEPLTATDPTYGTRLGSGHADVAASTNYAQTTPCVRDD